MKKFEKIFIGSLIGGTFPLLLFLLAFVIWYYFNTNEEWALYYVLSGLLIGLVIDFRFLKGWIDKRYELPEWFAAAIYILYSITIYGIFMGFPVSNLIMGFPAGYYYGKRILFNHTSLEESQPVIRKVSLFTGLVMAVFCVASGFIALRGEGVGPDIRGMFGFGFEVTKPMLLGITIIGGIFLVWLQVMVTRITMKITVKHNA